MCIHSQLKIVQAMRREFKLTKRSIKKLLRKLIENTNIFSKTGTKARMFVLASLTFS